MNNFFVILIIISVISSLAKTAKKKQAEQRKRGTLQNTPDKTAFPRPVQRVPAPAKPAPVLFSPALMPAKPVAPAAQTKAPVSETALQEGEKMPALQRAFSIMPVEADYSVMAPRFEERMTISGEGESFNDLLPDSAMHDAAPADEQHAVPRLALDFDSDALLKSIIISQILKRPRLGIRRVK
jgi:hypothetical protein